MGSRFSSEVPPPRPPRKYLLSFPEERFPEEASRAPEDVQDWYSHFLETLFCLPHKDGKGILILEPPDDFVPDSRARPGWARKRLRKAYELLGDGHPRIVRYIGPLESGNGVIVERLEPGPIDWYSIPALTVPLPQEMSRNDKLLLFLYYRWALQVLSAFRFAHSRSVFIRNFCSQLVWLRSDFSLAITGFIAASAPEIEEESRRDGIASERESLQDPARPYSISLEEFDRRVKEENYSPCPFSDGEWIIDGSASDDIYEGGNENGSVKEDLHYWAVFVKFLMNDGSPDASARNHEIPNEFENARLGTIRANAMNGRYESAAEIVQDVKVAAVQMGIKVVGDDEVDIDDTWENVFEVCERRLCFRKQE
ncbi:hypothetical protein FB567DRAFT_587509 [Paraphoma chrysanthemicola]|uniref:Protein kinase domain-containing protein n=1 Tax=Paraphoma chrysanthemicola TaxID=798071 RepID=A0A8K0W343_9PLEO|nr:hypothetical protein FB567DRAFT_587509 [Paraphoma chrysanthemicola]